MFAFGNQLKVLCSTFFRPETRNPISAPQPREKLMNGVSRVARGEVFSDKADEI